jgi:uncharacterized protein YjiS (DUF1127 family)
MGRTIALRLWAVLSCWRQRRREQRELLALTDRELRDIRASRIDALAAARQQTLRPCLCAGASAAARR